MNDLLRENPLQRVEFRSRQPELALKEEIGFQGDADLHGIAVAPTFRKPIIQPCAVQMPGSKAAFLYA
ncbi:hypothetical protein GCM10010987_75820 [Bradyrhizobium guangdongense]|uniref:Uncharacterized protein n=1 Tax=Bradyrhizobium guangdongense TaxID=1325090 RepID=A0AA87WDH3_9BRAD|nr:hypothetical protein GCM10010987_75820 [Bradyrhizobium guangdongense]